jgi:hypothetical protein
MDHQEAPRLHVAATRSVGTALKNTTEQRIRKRVGLQRPHRAGCLHDLEQVEFGIAYASQQFVPSDRKERYQLVGRVVSRL